MVDQPADGQAVSLLSFFLRFLFARFLSNALISASSSIESSTNVTFNVTNKSMKEEETNRVCARASNPISSSEMEEIESVYTRFLPPKLPVRVLYLLPSPLSPSFSFVLSMSGTLGEPCQMSSTCTKSLSLMSIYSYPFHPPPSPYTSRLRVDDSSPIALQLGTCKTV